MPDVGYLALGSGPDHFGLLASGPVEQWRSLDEFRTVNWKDSSQRMRLERIGGCLDKLSATLLQVHRMRNHHDELLGLGAQIIKQTGGMAALRGALVLADFENLLLQARSVLDRLTWLISTEFQQQSSSFRSLRPIVEAAARKRQEAAKLLPVIDEVSPWIYPLLARNGDDEALRDLVGHKHAATEGVESCLTVIHIGARKVLAFDCEIQLPKGPARTPILGASRDAGRFISYFVLNALSVLVGRATRPLQEYEPQWVNRTVVPSEYIIDEPPGSPLTDRSLMVVRRMTPDGFEVANHNVRPQLWACAVTL